MNSLFSVHEAFVHFMGGNCSTGLLTEGCSSILPWVLNPMHLNTEKPYISQTTDDQLSV